MFFTDMESEVFAWPALQVKNGTPSMLGMWFQKTNAPPAFSTEFNILSHTCHAPYPKPTSRSFWCHIPSSFGRFFLAFGGDQLDKDFLERLFFLNDNQPSQEHRQVRSANHPQNGYRIFLSISGIRV